MLRFWLFGLIGALTFLASTSRGRAAISTCCEGPLRSARLQSPLWVSGTACGRRRATLLKPENRMKLTLILSHSGKVLSLKNVSTL